MVGTLIYMLNIMVPWFPKDNDDLEDYDEDEWDVDALVEDEIEDQSVDPIYKVQPGIVYLIMIQDQHGKIWNVEEGKVVKPSSKGLHIVCSSSNETWMDCGLQKSDWSGWVFLERDNQWRVVEVLGETPITRCSLIAWAVVTVENKDNWLWFLVSLGDDLNLNRGATVTIISDGHKGLKEAVREWLHESART
ncbi:hypothetical protein Tco_1547684 [Tanacetum coccineum]